MGPSSQDWCTAVAFCSCESGPAVCLHAWLPVLDELESSAEPSRLGGFSPESWTVELRRLLWCCGVQDVHKWYGHDVRRGAARDTFLAAGPEAMRSLSSDRPYVSRDEVTAGLLAQQVIDDSAPEN